MIKNIIRNRLGNGVRIFIMLFCIGSMVGSESYAAQHINQGISADRLSTLLRSFSTYTADFSQSTVAQDGRVLERASGEVMIKRPKKLRWVIVKPAQQVLMTDGKWFWMYDIDLAQATQQLLATKTSVDPVLLLSGSAEHLAQDFSIELIKSAKSGGSEGFVLIPKKREYGFQKVTLIFQQGILVQMVAENNLMQTSTFHFTHVKINKRLSDAVFVFHVPSGVDLVKS